MSMQPITSPKPRCYGSTQYSVKSILCIKCKWFYFCARKRHRKILSPDKFRGGFRK